MHFEAIENKKADSKSPTFDSTSGMLKIKVLLKKAGRCLVICSGLIFLFLLVFAFTTGPFWIYYNLGAAESNIREVPENIVLMGGGGFPSESNLMRAYYTQHALEVYPNAQLILALPGDTTDSSSSVIRLKDYLVSQGIAASRIHLESEGTNTRSQCLQISKMINMVKPLLVISSPEHLKRSVRCFRKLGFTHVNGLPAFETAIEANLFYSDSKLGGRKIPGTDVGENLQVRYQFWTHLRYEVIVIREYFALSYYWVKGWM